MKTWQHEINDVLIIEHKGVEQVARLVRYEDQLDDTKPVYVNLRSKDDKGWYQRQVKVQPSQIKGVDNDYYERRDKEWRAELKARCDARWAKMSDAEKQIVHKQYQEIFGQASRSPIEMLIDRACGLE